MNVDLDTEESAPKKDAHQSCVTEFFDMDDKEILNMKPLILKDDSNEIVWDDLLDGECLKWDDANCEGDTWKKGFELTVDAVLNDFFPLH